MKVKSESEVAQLCPTLSDPMYRSLPGSSVHGIFQARVLEWGASAFFIHNSKGGILFGEGNGTPLQYSCLENPMDGGAWKATVHGVAKSRTRLSDFTFTFFFFFFKFYFIFKLYITFTFHFHALEKEMATHSSVLAWRIPGTGESGGLPSMGSHRVGHD